MGLPKGQQVDFEALEARRLQAAQLFEQGLSQAAVSRRLGVKSASVCRWHQAWLEGGAQALRQQAPAGRKPRLVASPGWSQAPAGRKPRLVASAGWSQAPAGRKRRLVASAGWSQAPAGRKPRLTAIQLERLEQELAKGPQGQGYRSELWTTARIGKLIRKLFGVRYHRGHVWRLLGQLGWTPQRPALRARERDEAAIAHWRRRRWPAKKGSHPTRSMDCPLGRKRVL